MELSQITPIRDTKPDPDEIDRKIAHSLIQHPGQTDQRLADDLGLSRRTISRRRNSLEVKTILGQVMSLPKEEIQSALLKAVRTVSDLLDHPDPRIKLGAVALIGKFATCQVFESQSNTFGTQYKQRKPITREQLRQAIEKDVFLDVLEGTDRV